MFVKDILDAAREKLVTIVDSTQLIDAAKLLTSGTDLVVVCDSVGILQGIITKTDVVRQMSVCQGSSCMCAASLVMRNDVVLCRAEDLLQDVSQLMKARHLKNIPVVDAENRPIGVVTARAVLRVLLSDAEFEEAQLIGYVKGVGFRANFDTLAQKHKNLKVYYRYSDAPTAGVSRTGNASTGLATAEYLEALLPGRDADYYFCGPQPFMVALYHGLMQWGIPASQVHFEFFGPRQELERVA